MDPQQVAKTARKIHRALLQSPNLNGEPTPAVLANFALTQAVAIESAIERYLAEHLEPTPAPIERLDPKGRSTWPDDNQHCRYALHDPLLDSDGVPGWVFGEGRWLDLDKVWVGMGGDETGLVHALMLRSVCWCPARSMSESEFRSVMKDVRP